MTDYPAIKLFGSPALTWNGRPITGFISNKAVAVLYFTAASGQPQAREVLATLLWTNSDDTYAKKNLRNVLSNLRDRLGTFVEINRETVSLAPALYATVDSVRFTALLKQAEQLAPSAPQRRALLAEAVTLYQGPFLEGFHLADAAAFDEWLRDEREHFGLLAIQAYHALVSDNQQQGNFLEAINYATRLLKLDPLREETHRQLMLLLAQDGQASAALAQYRACQKLLHDELGVEPDPETKALYQRIQAGEFRQVGAMPVIRAPARSAPTPPRIVLPAELTGFVGRETEVAQVQQRLADPGCRLLTITGMGGVGKTRLALRVSHVIADQMANEQPSNFQDGIYFVPLAALEPNAQSEHQIATTIAAELQIPLSGATPPASQLIQALANKALLLLLDNCEHLPMAPFLNPLLQQTQGVKCLVTSRTRLNVRGEHLYSLSGLTTPEVTAPSLLDLDAGALSTYSAIRLFVQSVQAIHPTFILDRGTASTIARICQLLHGLPLGIELAASWVRFLAVEEIAQEIQQNLDFLDATLGAGTDPQRSLRAIFNHSWRLLSATEQQVLRRLAVFRGGFTRTAAMQVAGATLPLLAALNDKSLVQRNDPDTNDHGSAQLNYRLHTVIHQYAAEQLAQAQETDEYQSRHATYMIELLAGQRSGLEAAGQLDALRLIHSEIENVRAAWQWLIRHLQSGAVTLAPGAQQISQGMDSLFHFYDMRSWFQEGETVFGQLAQQLAIGAAAPAQATPRPDGEPSEMIWRLQAQAQARQGWFAFHLGRYAESRRLLEESLRRLQQLGAEADTIFNLNYLGALLRHLGEFAQATTYLHEALRLAQHFNDQMGASIALNVLGQIASLQGDLAQARRWCQQALQIKRTIGDRWGMTFSLTYLGRVVQATGDYATAQKFFAESLVIYREIGDQRGEAFALQNLGDTAYAAGKLDEAQQRYQASLAIYRAIGNRAESSLTLARLGETQCAAGDYAQARQSLSEALTLAWSLPSTPGLLAALLGLAALALANGQPEQALPPLRFVYQHAASNQQQRQRAAQLLTAAGAAVTGDTDWDLASYVETVLTDALL